MNTLGLIANNDFILNQIIETIGEENKKYIQVEYISDDEALQNEAILKKIDLLNDKKVDFIAIANINCFINFDKLQESSPLLILNPIDTLILSLGGDLNQFPLWVLDNKLAKRLLNLHGFSYQVANQETKDNLLKLKHSDLSESEIKEIISTEISKYTPYGVDSIVFTQDYNIKDVKQVDEIDIYKIEYSYIREIINLLNK